jgi:hypothetical protein
VAFPGGVPIECFRQWDDDAAFIAAAPEDVETLVAEVERLLAELQAIADHQWECGCCAVMGHMALNALAGEVQNGD